MDLLWKKNPGFALPPFFFTTCARMDLQRWTRGKWLWGEDQTTKLVNQRTKGRREWIYRSQIVHPGNLGNVEIFFQVFFPISSRYPMAMICSVCMRRDHNKKGVCVISYTWWSRIVMDYGGLWVDHFAHNGTDRISLKWWEIDCKWNCIYVYLSHQFGRAHKVVQSYDAYRKPKVVLPVSWGSFAAHAQTQIACDWECVIKRLLSWPGTTFSRPLFYGTCTGNFGTIRLRCGSVHVPIENKCPSVFQRELNQCILGCPWYLANGL